MQVRRPRGRRPVTDWEKNRVDYDKKILDSIIRSTEGPTFPIEGSNAPSSVTGVDDFEDRIYDLLCSEHRHIEGFCKSKSGLISWKLGEIERTIRTQEQIENAIREQERPDQARDEVPLEACLSHYKRLSAQLSKVAKCIKTLGNFINDAKTGFTDLIHTYEKETNSSSLAIKFENNILDNATFISKACDPTATLQDAHARLKQALENRKSFDIDSNTLSRTLSQDRRDSAIKFKLTVPGSDDTGSTTNTIDTGKGSSDLTTRTEQSSCTLAESEDTHVSDGNSSHDSPHPRAQKFIPHSSFSTHNSRSKSRGSRVEVQGIEAVGSIERRETGRLKPGPSHSICSAFRGAITQALNSFSPAFTKANKPDEYTPLISDEPLRCDRSYLAREPSQNPHTTQYATIPSIEEASGTSLDKYLRRDRYLRQSAFFTYPLAMLLLLVSVCLLTVRRREQSIAVDVSVITSIAASLLAAGWGLICMMVRRVNASRAWHTLALVVTVLVWVADAFLVRIMIDENL